jgi:hypothetical protein
VPILVPSLPETTATTTVPETVVPAPTPESVPTITSEPAPVVAAPEPITFIKATGHVILSAFKEFVPFAFARKKSKSKPAKKKNPPPPKKKSKAKEPPTPPKLTKKQKQEQAKREVLLLTRSLAKLTKALVELNKTRAEQKPIALPTVAKVTEGTKVQVKEVAVAPAMPSAKKDAVAQVNSGGKIQQLGVAFGTTFAPIIAEAAKSLDATKSMLCAPKSDKAVQATGCGLISFGVDMVQTGYTGLVGSTMYGQSVPTSERLGAVFVTGLNASGAGSSAKILIGSAIKHIVSRHTAEGALHAGASIFANEADILTLIKKAESSVPELQAGGNYQRVVTNSVNVGIDRTTGTVTKVYTVITDAVGNLITAFPGRP